MDYGFIFKIGEFVQAVGKRTKKEKDKGAFRVLPENEAPRLFVIEQRLSISSGGVRRYYVCSSMYPSGISCPNLVYLVFEEIELVKEESNVS